MLHQETKLFLQNRKNLLAFSAGSDSSALFFLLLEANIPFDIAIVDYGVRQQSKEEVAYAQKLATQYNLKCYTYEAPPITTNFEAKARKIRYQFFESLIQQHQYETLLSAHHLADRLEWFLMQLTKGAGCVELLGMREFQKRENYTLVRPLLHVNKKDILHYLEKNQISYFHDNTNDDIHYKRNLFRHHFALPLLEEYPKGIERSFEYLERDVVLLRDGIEMQSFKELGYCIQQQPQQNIRAIDAYLKKKGYLLSRHEKELIIQEDSVVVGRKYIVSKIKNYIFVAPFINTKGFDKQFKERCRILKIDPKLRPYLFRDLEVLEFMSGLLA